MSVARRVGGTEFSVKMSGLMLKEGGYMHDVEWRHVSWWEGSGWAK
jgi:hypothetical protein